MRKQHQLQILELLGTIKEAQKAGLYADCQDGALAIAEFIDQMEGEGTNTAALLAEYCRLVFLAHNGEVDKKPLRKQLYEIENSVKSELRPNKFKALFLPYYDNTWESMKSVYEAFSHDPLFETEVVIIPVVRNTNEGTKFIWNDYLTPHGIPNTHYDVYDFEADMPDVVFYNQPYDGVNIPKFNSENVRKYSGHMIYIPYAIIPIKVQGALYDDTITELESIQRCDTFIAQSELFREEYMARTPLYKKALTYGHPKFDILYAAKFNGEFTRYPEWETSIGDRRVFLLNTHYSYMIDGVALHPGVKRLIDNVAKNDDMFLIWRPHPQTFLMKISTQMRVLLDLAQEHERMIVDRSPNIKSAYMYANAVVSLFPSSIVMDALFLDLPTFVLGREAVAMSECNRFYEAVMHEKPSERSFDDWDNVQGYVEQNIHGPLDAFLEEILHGKDSKLEDRATFRKQQFPNANGTVSARILRSIKNMLVRG